MKMMLVAALAVLFACPVAAQNCAPSQRVEAGLALRYGEVVVSDELLIAPGSSVEVRWRVWRNEVPGTWSFTGSRNGRTCIFQYGKNYKGQTVHDFFEGVRL